MALSRLYALSRGSLTRHPSIASVGVANRTKSAVSASYTPDVAPVTSERHDGAPVRRRIDKLDPSFLDHQAAFKNKSTWEVLRALIVFHLCSIGPLVDHNMKLMKLGQSVLGRRLFGALMKSTFYGQFVGGEDQDRIKPVINRMHTFGVKSILDYSVEEDISEKQARDKELRSADDARLADTASLKNYGSHKDRIRKYHAHDRLGVNRRFKVTGARTYFYVNEAQCEKNMETFLRCIEAVADSTYGTGFSAIKLTALGRPSLLLSEVIVRARRFWQSVSGQSGFVIEGKLSKEAFVKRFIEKADYDSPNPNVKKWLGQMTGDKEGLIHLFSWSGLIDCEALLRDVFLVPNLKTGKMEPVISALTLEEEEKFRNMMHRLNTLFEAAKELDVRVMVDAEQSYLQPAIHRLTMELMNKFNRDKAIVFNTYQCYLKSAYHTLVLDLEQAERQNFFFGAKLVRGAYMEQERARALKLGYEDPINKDFETTTEMYHQCLDECLSRMARIKREEDKEEYSKQLAVMVASHNADTIRFAIEKMNQLQISPEDRLICFGQLLGMCDNVSFPLAQAGYSVYKYVPYGPVNEVLPYLSRRAHENKGMLSKLEGERRLLRKELVSRLLKGKIFGTPKGDYMPVGFEQLPNRQ